MPVDKTLSYNAQYVYTCCVAVKERTDRMEKTILITGCAGGIGAGIAEKLLKSGYNVVGMDIFGEDNAVIAGLKENTGFRYLQCDLTDIGNLPAAAEKAASFFGRIDGLVNNAATSTRGPLDDVTEDDWDRYMLLNQKSVLFLTKAVVPYIRKQGKGSIVNMASLRSKESDGRHVLYCMAKGAIVSFTIELANMLAKDHIRANCISPAYVLTPMTRHNLEREGWLEKQLSVTLLDRLIEPSDIANMAEFLLSDASEAITGQNMEIDGGMRVKGS